MRVEISTEAEQDVEAIGDCIGDNLDRAISYLRELRTKCVALAEHSNGFLPSSAGMKPWASTVAFMATL